MSQLCFTAVASSGGVAAWRAAVPRGTQHRDGAAGVACGAALVSPPCTHAAENPGLVHGFWHRFLFNPFLTFQLRARYLPVCVFMSILSASLSP